MTRHSPAGTRCEFNVIEQVENGCQTTIVRDGWERGQTRTVHGGLSGLDDGQERPRARSWRPPSTL
jgi:carbonic anhydrase